MGPNRIGQYTKRGPLSILKNTGEGLNTMYTYKQWRIAEIFIYNVLDVFFFHDQSLLTTKFWLFYIKANHMHLRSPHTHSSIFYPSFIYRLFVLKYNILCAPCIFYHFSVFSEKIFINSFSKRIHNFSWNHSPGILHPKVSWDATPYDVSQFI